MSTTPKRTVMIAEDDNGIIEVMRIILEQEGYDILTAGSGSEIENLLKEHRPNLIFLDIRLGGESGEVIGERLRSDPGTKDIPLIFLSADQETEQIAGKVKADGFLLKPFDIDSLVNTVKKHLQ